MPSATPFVQTGGTGVTWSGGAAQGTVTIPTDRAILVWNPNTFRVDAGDMLTFSFQAPSQNSAVLNKVGYTTTGALGGTETAVINGTVFSNGRVFVAVNGSIQVGSGAVVNTAGGLFLTTLVQDPGDFAFTSTPGGAFSLSGASTGSITFGTASSNATAVPAINIAAGSQRATVTGNLGLWAGAITLNNVTVTGDMIVNQNNPQGAGAALNLTGAAPTVVSGNLTATTNNGTISQGAGALTVSGTSNLVTNGNAGVSLANTANDFNTVQVTTGAGTSANVSLGDVNSIVLGTTSANSTVGNDLSVTAGGNITTGGTVNVTGNASLTSTGASGIGNITFANNSTVAGAAGISASTGNGSITIATLGNLTTGTISARGTGGVTLLTGGVGYTSVPTVTVAGGTGVASVSLTGITGLVGGTGYTSAPTVSFTGGGGSGAAATATFDAVSGAVTGINFTSGGTGYTSMPTIVLTGGGGTGASANPVGAVSGLTISGSFASAPTVTLSASGSTTGATFTVAAIPTEAVSITSTGTVTINGTTSSTAGSNITVTAPVVTANATGGIGATGTGTAAGGTLNLASLTSTAGSLTTPYITAGNISLTATGGNISQFGTSILTTSNGGSVVANAGTTGNITLTNSNVLNNATLQLTGRDISVTSTRNITVTSTNATGNLTINTTPSAAGAGNVTIGSGGGTASQGITVAGNLNVTTNGSLVTDDTAATELIQGSVNVNTFAAGAGAIYNVTLGAAGTGYTSAPTVSLSGSGGTGGNATATLGVSTFTISNAGAGYTSFPTITFNNTGTGGSGASAVVTLSNNPSATTPATVTGIVITNPGSGYTSLPTIAFSAAPTGGTTALGSVATGNIVALTINGTGNGYTAAPTVAFTGGGGTGASATASAPAAAGDVSFTAASAGVGGSGRYGQFNVIGKDVNLQENTTLNVGNITARALTVNSTAADVLINGNVTTAANISARASSGAITEGASGLLTVGTTSSWNSSNSFGTNLSNSGNSFGGTVTVINGGTDIIVASSNITFTPGNVTGGSLTVNTVGTTNNTATFTGGNATDVRINSAGPIVLNNALVRNLTLNSTAASGTGISQTANLTANGTVTITSSANVTLDNISNNITGPVVLANVTAPETLVLSGRNLTISGNSTGNLTAIAGGGAGNTSNTFSNPWNLVLGNLNVSNLNGAAMNSATGITRNITAVNVDRVGAGFTSAPVVTFSAPPTGGVAPTATASVSGGVLTGIVINTPGSGYTSTPSVTLTGGGFTQVATANVSTVINTTAVGNAALGGVATEGNSGTITQSSNARLHVENVLNLSTFNNNIVLGNNGNSNGRVQLSTGGGLGLAGSGDITYTEDPTVKLGNLHTAGNATITSRFGGIIEDPAGNVSINVGGLLTLNAANGSVQIGNLTHTAGTTTGNIAAISVNATGSTQLFSTGNLVLNSMAANSLTVTSLGAISQSGPLRIFGASTFNAGTGITLTDAGNNFGPVTLNVTDVNQNISITEAGTLNLRSVSMGFQGNATTVAAAGNGTFTATSLNGDIIDTGLSGAKIGGLVAPAGVPNATSVLYGTGVVSLNAANGNITIDDPTTEFLTANGVLFNARNVTLSVLGNSTRPLVLGAAGATARASGNLTVTSALGDIVDAGNIVVTGDAFFQAGTRSVTLAQTGNQFGTLKFVGNQVSIQQTGDMKIVTGSQAVGPAQLATNSGNITIVDRGGLVTFGNVVTMSAPSGNITLPKLLQAAGTLTVNASGTKDLSALSISADLSGRSPVNQGAGAYNPPQP